MLKVEDLTLKFKHDKSEEVTLFAGLNCEIRKGDVIGIIGPSGSGKSTFIKCLAALEKPDSGHIYFKGEDILAKGADQDSFRKHTGMVFQDFNLFNHLTVLDNITLAPMILDKKPADEAKEEALALLKKVGIAECAEYYPEHLSGGQKQRAAIARTLAMKPEIVFFDEPTSAMDTAKKKEVAAVIKNLAEEGMTMVIATHEHKLVRRVCNRVFFFCQGDLYEEGTVDEIFNSPKRMLTRAFVNSIYGMRYDITSRDFDIYNMNSEIEMYCASNGLMGYETALEHVCEEVLLNFIPFCGDVHVHVRALYNGSPELTITQDNCNSPILNADVDDLSLTIIKGMCASYTEEQNGYNRILKFEFSHKG